jgi:hypothetical protein
VPISYARSPLAPSIQVRPKFIDTFGQQIAPHLGHSRPSVIGASPGPGQERRDNGQPLCRTGSTRSRAHARVHCAETPISETSKHDAIRIEESRCTNDVLPRPACQAIGRDAPRFARPQHRHSRSRSQSLQNLGYGRGTSADLAGRHTRSAAARSPCHTQQVVLQVKKQLNFCVDGQAVSVWPNPDGSGLV